MKKGIKVFVSITLCALGCGIIAFWCYLNFYFGGSPIEKQRFKNEVVLYLEETYHQQIEVIDVDYAFKSKSYYADVKTTGDSQILFRVSQTKNGEMVDNYIMEYWKDGIHKDLSNYATEIFNFKGSGSVYFTEGLPHSLKHIDRAAIPEFLSVRNEFKAKIFAFIDVYRQFDDKNYDEISEIYNVIQYVFEKYHFDSMEITYSDDTKVNMTKDEYDKLKEKDEITDFIQKTKK